MPRNNGIDSKGGEALGQALQHNASLTCLDLGENQLGLSAAVALAAGLPQSGLRDLRLDQNRLELEGAAALAAGLPGCNSLQVGIISLSGCNSLQV